MRFVRRGVLYGLAVWFVPFAVSFAIHPIKQKSPALFESIMPVVVSGVTTLFAVLYFLHVRRNFVREGVVVGLIWLAMCIVIDLPLMLPPPMSYSLSHYMADIGVAYLIIPIITSGVALAAAGHVEVRQRLVKLDRKTEVPDFVPQL